jgi:hypothetical protein
VICVSLFTIKAVDTIVPKLTDVALVNPEPVIVTRVAAGALLGLTPVTTGAEAGEAGA